MVGPLTYCIHRVLSTSVGGVFKGCAHLNSFNPPYITMPSKIRFLKPAMQTFSGSAAVGRGFARHLNAQLFGRESDEVVAAKTAYALEAGARQCPCFDCHTDVAHSADRCCHVIPPK